MPANEEDHVSNDEELNNNVHIAKDSSFMHQNMRIFKGQTARKDRYPWQIILLFSTKKMNVDCGGTLISTKHILTAAHCLFDVKQLE